MSEQCLNGAYVVIVLRQMTRTSVPGSMPGGFWWKRGFVSSASYGLVHVARLEVILSHSVDHSDLWQVLCRRKPLPDTSMTAFPDFHTWASTVIAAAKAPLRQLHRRSKRFCSRDLRCPERQIPLENLLVAQSYQERLFPKICGHPLC